VTAVGKALVEKMAARTESGAPVFLDAISALTLVLYGRPDSILYVKEDGGFRQPEAQVAERVQGQAEGTLCRYQAPPKIPAELLDDRGFLRIPEDIPEGDIMLSDCDGGLRTAVLEDFNAPLLAADVATPREKMGFATTRLMVPPRQTVVVAVDALKRRHGDEYEPLRLGTS
jgi:hypothetical protein